jgi:hypothetical protein
MVVFDGSGTGGCDAASLGSWFPTFQNNILPELVQAVCVSIIGWFMGVQITFSFSMM